jgi:predicted MPP superfamily phosphohydrolase
VARWFGRNWARLRYAVRVEPTWLELNEAYVAVRDLPPGFDGFRIVQLSDLHCSRKVTPAFIGEAVDLALAQNPDVVVLTGDFIHHGYHHVRDAAAAISRLAAPHGVYAVLGNHDYSIRNALGLPRYRHLHTAVEEALTWHGIRVLHNEAVPLTRGGAALYLAGLDDLWSRRCDPDRALAGLPADAPRVVLAHNPQTVLRLNGHRCDLMLSGHTHGGQVDWPGLGRVTLGKSARRFAAGLYAHGQTHLYVNKGVGFGFRFRFNVRPEVAVVILGVA